MKLYTPSEVAKEVAQDNNNPELEDTVRVYAEALERSGFSIMKSNQMKLYKVSREDLTYGADFGYEAMIVAANSEEEARHISPSPDYKWHDGQWWFQHADGCEEVEEHSVTWTNDLADLKVELLGYTDDTNSGVLLASFLGD